MNLYDIAETVHLTATFKHPVTKKLVDPETVTCTVRPPSATKEEDNLTPTVKKVSTGIYEAEVEADESGRWYFAFDSSGGFKAAEEKSFTVRKQNVPR